MSRTPGKVARLLALGGLVAIPAAIVGQDWGGWLITVAFGAVGILLVWQRPREVVGWLLVGIAVAFSAVGALVPGSATQVVHGRADLGITLYAWFGSAGGGVFFGLFVALAALFPTGGFPVGRLGLAAKIAVAIPIVGILVLPLGPSWPVQFADGSEAQVNLPIGIAREWSGWSAIRELAYVAIVGALAISVATLVLRFRRSTGPERAQFKWFLAALIATLGAVVFAFAMILLRVGEESTWMWTPAVVAYLMIPWAILVAIQRYRLYEIDRIISRTVSYLLLTGVLAAVFAGLVIALQSLLEGVTQGGTLAVAASTLAAFALFQPVRRRIQTAVDRRFDRSRVDAEALLGAFVGHVRDQVDLEQLRAAVLATSSGAVRPTAASLWLRGGPDRQ